MSAIRNFVVVRLDVAGIHCWPECNVDGVEFLKHPHRHIFKIKCRKWVEHPDRAIEIIKLKAEIEKFLRAKYKPASNHIDMLDFGRDSCETIAMSLMEAFQLTTCEVLEDGENGASLCR